MTVAMWIFLVPAVVSGAISLCAFLSMQPGGVGTGGCAGFIFGAIALLCAVGFLVAWAA